MHTRILIFEDDNTHRLALKSFLNGTKGYKVIGDFGTCERAAEQTNTLDPDVVIMDIGMPKVDGIEGLRMIKEQKPDTAIIMYTVFEDDQHLFDSICAGANGYLLKNGSFAHLPDAIENIKQGGAPLSPTIAKRIMHSFQKKNNYKLSTREKEVLQYLVKGYSYRMIADAIFVSLSTVQAHVKNIYTKLHVNCGRQAVAIALRDKIV